MDLKKLDKALDIVRRYNGDNPFIRDLKLSVRPLTEFAVEYVLSNYDYKTEHVNKIVKIADWFGNKLNEKYLIGFAPKKLLIFSIFGEMGESYHCYVKWRQSQIGPALIYVSKKALLDDIHPTPKLENIRVDFDMFDKISKYGYKLKPHQKEGIQFLLSRRCSLLADEPGLAKTAQLIVASLAGGFRKVLIICPASLKSTWKYELCNYVDEDQITIVKGTTWQENTKYTIINYDILDNFYEVPMVYDEVKGKYVKSRKKSDHMEAIRESQLFQSKFDLVIIDECHKLSNNKSIRYRTIEEFLKRCDTIRSIYLVTGTPITNNTVNLYNILKLIGADVVRDYKYYMKRYCGAREIMNKKLGRKVLIPSGSTNLEELREKIKGIYIRRTREDIGFNVENYREVLRYDLTQEERNEYDKLFDDYAAKQMEIGNDITQYKALVETSILRQWAAKKMIPHSIDIAEGHIENGEKVIIMCSFDEEIEELREHFKSKCVVYNGKMTAKAKDKAKQEFINDPKKMVFIGNIMAAGVGLTLIAANVCIFNSFAWVSGDNTQAELRIIRIGQDKKCFIYYQIFNDTIFEYMLQVVNGKQDIIDTVIKTEHEKEEIRRNS